jgi:uncharacterized membrane protein YkgB
MLSMTGTAAVVTTAVIECFVGITLITGRLLRTGLAVLAGALIGIMSPLVLFLPDMFPHGTPTLEAQYVFKDIVLAAAGLVVAVRLERLTDRWLGPDMTLRSGPWRASRGAMR